MRRWEVRTDRITNGRLTFVRGPNGLLIDRVPWSADDGVSSVRYVNSELIAADGRRWKPRGLLESHNDPSLLAVLLGAGSHLTDDPARGRVILSPVLLAWVAAVSDEGVTQQGTSVGKGCCNSPCVVGPSSILHLSSCGRTVTVCSPDGAIVRSIGLDCTPLGFYPDGDEGAVMIASEGAVAFDWAGDVRWEVRGEGRMVLRGPGAQSV